MTAKSTPKSTASTSPASQPQACYTGDGSLWLPAEGDGARLEQAGSPKSEGTRRQQPWLSVLTCVKRRAGVSFCRGDRDEKMSTSCTDARAALPTHCGCLPASSAQGCRHPPSQAGTPPGRLPLFGASPNLPAAAEPSLPERETGQSRCVRGGKRRACGASAACRTPRHPSAGGIPDPQPT